MPNTILTLTAIGLPPYSARGLSEALKPIDAAANLRRTVNGTLVDVSDSLFRKFSVVITGEDTDPPSFDMVWPGKALTVDCITELAIQDSETDPPTLGRTIVPGSQRTADGFIFYRPRLSMLVTDWSADSDEWQHVTSWSLSLEEV